MRICQFFPRSWRALRILVLTATFCGFAGITDLTVFAQDAERISFNDQIRPLLSSNCFACHGPDEAAREAGLRLDTASGATADLGGYAAVQPGHAENSELLTRITSDDPDMRMPPAGFGKPLSETEIDLIKRWIAQGADYEVHWSYKKPTKSALPQVDDTDWALQPIDRFILARLEALGLRPSPRADRTTLARRVSLALTGLPPTYEQAQAFVNDQSPDAYEHYVDDLLASPAFGERWARVWLDLARYADSAGYADDPSRTIWGYRDYVIRALNQNKPFDQFTLEQIAGDLLPNPTDDQLVATAFHRNTMTNNEGGTNDEQFRNEAIVDRVNTTMAVWMGTTMACAQCHSHKYDPISQAEYFQFFDFFNQSADADRRDESPLVELYSQEQRDRMSSLKERIEALDAVLAKQTPELDAELDQWLTQFRQPPTWDRLVPAAATVLDGAGQTLASDNSLSLQVNDEGSVRLAGERPGQAIYELRYPIGNPQKISALSLNIDEAQKTNFVIGRVTLRWQPSEADVLQGRFVRVELPGQGRILHLAEVEVRQGDTNWATQGTASQSSTGYDAPASRANDGNSEGDFFKGSVTHNNQEDNPWWEVDLGQARPIEAIKIFNRTDGGLPISQRLQGYRVSVLDENRNVVWSEEGGQVALEPLAHSLSGARSLPIVAAHADFSQPNFPAEAVFAGVAEGKPTANNTGWAIGGATGQPHQLVLSLSTPSELAGGELIARVEMTSVHGQHVLTDFHVEVTEDEGITQWASLPGELRSIVLAESQTPEERAKLAAYHRTVSELLSAPRNERQAAQAELAAIKPMTTVPVMRDLPEDKRRTTRIQLRGNYTSLSDTVSAGVPSAFHSLPEDQPRNRMALAAWLVSPENPLTPRVVVNRHWEQVFGIGLVETSEEFGSQGEPPTHPELLDWLAVDLVENGWDLKRLLKQLVMSETYCQTSRVSGELVAEDPDNRLYARGPRFRVSAEMVRDQALFVAGLLSPKMHGPPVRPPQPSLGLSAAFGSATDWQTSEGGDRYRRGIYTTWRRSNPYPSMATFDAPNREVCTLRRSRTNTPLQALVTLNDPVYVEAAQALARRTLSENDLDAKLAAMIRYAMQRDPKAAEIDRLRGLFDQVQAAYQGKIDQATQVATDPLGALPEGADPVELAALTIVANAVLNLDEILMPL